MSAAQKEGDILPSSLLLQWARGSLHAQSLDSVSASLIRALCAAGLAGANANSHASQRKMDFSLNVDEMWLDQACQLLIGLLVD